MYVHFSFSFSFQTHNNVYNGVVSFSFFQFVQLPQGNKSKHTKGGKKYKLLHCGMRKLVKDVANLNENKFNERKRKKQMCMCFIFIPISFEKRLNNVYIMLHFATFVFAILNETLSNSRVVNVTTRGNFNQTKRWTEHWKKRNTKEGKIKNTHCACLDWNFFCCSISLMMIVTWLILPVVICLSKRLSHDV